MKKASLNICIGGSAGQGLATIGQILAKSVVRKGYHLHCSQVYESRVRGGYNGFVLRVGNVPMVAPTEEIDILVALNPDSFEVNKANLAENAVVLSDSGVTPDEPRHLHIPFKEMGEGARANTIMVGALGALLGFELNELDNVLTENLGKLAPPVLKANQDVLRKAYDWTMAKQNTTMLLPQPSMAADTNLVLNASESLALGALAAGLKFCSFYPMSPGTDISLNIADAAQRMGVVVEQAEDEIAAINIVIAASYAGARSMVATSGGGFDLMGEGVSLAGMLEIPVVIDIAMRPGPATGLPTRTEQADLNLALYAGHGEFPRAIFAPGDITQCFELMKQAFAMAEKYHGPVFVLTDQYLADSYRNVAPFDLGPAPEPPVVLNQPDDAGFETYALTPDGVSPRRLPGFGKTLVLADSDEHTPDGHITEDLDMRVKMQQKRMIKLDGLRKDALAPMFSGDGQPEILLACWGSTVGAVTEAAQKLCDSGKKVGVCHFMQVYPLRPETFMPQFEAAKQVVMVESNFTGQLAMLIRRETGFDLQHKVLRYDGLAMTANYIMQALEA